jgi:hypothetical protein
MVAALAVCALARGGEVACPGAYPGHLQGIARDDDGNLYWSFTTFLIKTDASGTERAKVAVPNHYGDLTWHDGKVYVAVNYGAFNKEPGKAKSWVCVHDANSLALLSSNAVPEVVHGAGPREIGARYASSRATGLVSSPMPSIATVTVSPAAR